MYVKCLCTSIMGPGGTLWFYSPECEIHKSLVHKDGVTWEQILAAINRLKGLYEC